MIRPTTSTLHVGWLFECDVRIGEMTAVCAARHLGAYGLDHVSQQKGWRSINYRNVRVDKFENDACCWFEGSVVWSREMPNSQTSMWYKLNSLSIHKLYNYLAIQSGTLQNVY